MRVDFVILVGCLLTIGSLSAQSDKGEFIVQNLKNEKVHILETKKIVLVVRANYSYALQLINDEEGLRARFVSFDGVLPDRGDELIFLSQENRKNFLFVANPKKVSKSGRPQYSNFFYLSESDLQWFKSNKIQKIYIKDTDQMEMRKFTLSTKRQTELKEMVMAFDKHLDRSKILSKPAILSYKSPTQWYKAPPVPKYANDVDATKVLDEKLSLAEKIKLEQKKAEKEIMKIRQNVLEERLAADKKKESFAREVAEARQKALDEIRAIKKSSKERIEAQIQQTKKQIDAFAWKVYQAKINSAEEIEKIKLKSLQQISQRNSEFERTLKELDQKRKLAKQANNRRIIEINEKSNQQINLLRKRVELKLDSLANLYKKKQEIAKRQLSLDEQKYTDKLYDFQRMVLDSISRMEERLVRYKAANAKSYYQSLASFEERLDLARKEYERELNDVQRDGQSKKESLEIKMVEEIALMENILTDKIKEKHELLKMHQSAIDSIKQAHRKQVILNRHQLEKELQAIAQSIITAQSRSAEAVAMAKKKGVLKVSAVQNEVEAQRVRILEDFKEFKKQLEAKQEVLNRSLTERLELHKHKSDSIKQHYLDRYSEIIVNFNNAVDRARQRNDSLQLKLSMDYKKTKAIYADSIMAIKQRASKAIALIEQEYNLDQNSNEEAYNQQKDIIRAKAHYKEMLLTEKHHFESKMLSLKQEHAEALATLQNKIKEETQKEFANLSDLRSTLREEMDIMRMQFEKFKKVQDEKIAEELEQYQTLLALMKIEHNKELLKLDSMHRSKKYELLDGFEVEKQALLKRHQQEMVYLRDSFQSMAFETQNAINQLHKEFVTLRDSLQRETIALEQKFVAQRNKAEQDALQEIEKVKQRVANEVYLARQSAREEIRRMKHETLDEILRLKKEIKLWKKKLKSVKSKVTKMKRK